MNQAKPPETRWRTFLMAGGAAVALHALLLSCHHLREARRPSDPTPQTEDNTPELLQFASSSDVPANLKVNALPANPVLPPPHRFTNASGPRPPGVEREGHPARAQRPSHRASSDRAGGTVQRHEARLRSRADREAGTVNREDWAQAIERLRGVVRQQPALSGGKVSAPQNDGTMSAEAYGRLWELAQPHRVSLPRDVLGPDSEPIEARRVPWPVVKDAALSIRHGQQILLPDAVLLIWFQGDHLYVLRSPWEPDRTS